MMPHLSLPDRARRHALQCLRATRRLRRDPTDIYKAWEIIGRMLHVDFGSTRRASSLVAAEARDGVDAALRQRLITLAMSTATNQGTWHGHMRVTLLLAYGGERHGAIFPLPAPWRRFLAAEGVRVDGPGSRMQWLVLQAASMASGLRRLLRLAVHSRRHAADRPDGPYWLVNDVGPAMVPTQPAEGEGRRARMVPFMEDWIRGQGIDGQGWAVCPGAQPTTLDSGYHISPSALPALDRRVLPGFVLAGSWIILRALWRWLTGDWKSALLVADAVEVEYARRLDRLPTASIYNCSRWTYRPLWTVLAEKRAGTRTAHVCYSTNFVPMRFRDRQAAPIPPGYDIATWPDLLLWDDAHRYKMELAGTSPKTRIHLVGAVPMGHREDALIDVPRHALGIFDVVPKARRHNATQGLVEEYYTDHNVAAFLSAVVDEAERHGFVPVVKMKRDVASLGFAAPRYQALVARLGDAGRIVVVDPAVSPNWLIPRLEAVVSLPFTSTSVIAKLDGVPSCFFDSTSTIVGRGPGDHDIPLILGQPALGDWLKDVASRRAEATSVRLDAV